MRVYSYDRQNTAKQACIKQTQTNAYLELHPHPHPRRVSGGVSRGWVWRERGRLVNMPHRLYCHMHSCTPAFHAIIAPNCTGMMILAQQTARHDSTHFNAWLYNCCASPPPGSTSTQHKALACIAPTRKQVDIMHRSTAMNHNSAA